MNAREVHVFGKYCSVQIYGTFAPRSWLSVGGTVIIFLKTGLQVIGERRQDRGLDGAVVTQEQFGIYYPIFSITCLTFPFSGRRSVRR